MNNLYENIMTVLREYGWTCEYHEPVSKLGECKQCDQSHRKTAKALMRGLGLQQEWMIDIGYGRVEFAESRAEAVERMVEITEDWGDDPPEQGALLMSRYVTQWQPET